ncbi:MAG TPA: rRNA maturation RNase YbeY [Acidobacteriota bacterium]|nr:rRNA maturation RNase YbeY [Acidobacteriota bacterium]
MFNKQRGLSIDQRELQAFAGQLAQRLHVAGGFSLVLVSDRVMADYNQRHRGKEGPTDVLSFPDRREPWEGAEEPYLGDVVISLETARRRMPGNDLQREVRRLCLHGLLHLMGYDHERDNGEMEQLEVRLRKEFDLI